MRGLWQLVVCSLFVIGCGGASDEPPKPLSKHIDDMHIARIPLDQKGTVVETQNQWSVAKMENANAEAMVQEADGQVHQAENDYKASKLAVDSAISQYENAKSTLAKANNIQPKGVNFDDFAKQHDDRDKRTRKAKERAENEKSKAVSARQNWLSAQSAADQATGRTGNMYDPMAPKEGPTATGGGISQPTPAPAPPQ
jgi:hypothetical protein